ncbi:hypothetical protein M9H77_07249 [Catharanthus roseus]|uniref:Uncharacterized protein n=1 Tax=Catharanthus roseus TaxID=4058 RepID=A0ACC0BUK2_CATRO|nr:hypothetical protein M9H77_07249 [Catharanthus roseus]
MECNWSNPSWKKMEAKSKQEDYQFKLARDMYNFIIVVAMDSMHMIMLKYDYYEHGPYDSYEEYHHSYGGEVYFEGLYDENVYERKNQITKVETLNPSISEEFPNVNKLPKAQEVTEESIVLYFDEEAFKEEPCCIMSGNSIENKEKERVEEKERLVERLCIFDSISIFSKESENLECSKEKESELEKSERVKENKCFIGKQENEKEEQREKEIVVFEKNEELNFYANETNSFFARKFVENVSNVSSFFDTFMENHNDFVSLNQLMSSASGQVEFSCKEQKLSNELLFKDFENRMGANLELFKVNVLALGNSNLRKEAFKQVCKDFVESGGLHHLKRIEHQRDLVSKKERKIKIPY